MIKGFPTDCGMLEPQVDLASIYLDQVHEDDVCVPFAREHGIPIYPSIVKALSLGGGELAVDGVLIIGEHGDYGSNEKGQKLYPRRSFFEQVCDLFSTSGHSVPVFNDKHLSYSWEQAKWMYDRALELQVPLMAGSSLPVAYRNPWLEYELKTPVEEALSLAYGGRQGVWSRELVTATEKHIEPRKPGRMEDNCENPALFLLEYADGLRAASLMLNGHLRGWGYAGRKGREVQGMEAFLHGDPHPHFVYMGLNIQEMFLTGKSQYPVERTLLISGTLDALMESRYRGYLRIETPHLDVCYRSYEKMPIRPTGPSAKPWRTGKKSG